MIDDIVVGNIGVVVDIEVDIEVADIVDNLDVAGFVDFEH